ncbi:hypothetical protein BJ165DRAFT_1456642 [Panaeolus papilionaceus]|nr:hypothetical protein BJ165DRAFT_1456642 [Panaeolus papilionaceus]
MANFEDPLLPPELEKLVVEMAMQEYICCKYNLADNQLRLHIQLTARRFYQWTLPFVFRALNKDLFSWHFHRMGPKFIDKLGELTKYTTHLAYTVDNRYMKGDHIRLLALIEKCPKIEDLTIWHANALWQVHDAVMKLTRLRRLSANFTGLHREQILSPVYLAVTHLDLLGGMEPSLITHFQNLSHLCINKPSDNWMELLDKATDKKSGCPSLRVIISMCDADEYEEYDDPRYVCLEEGMEYEVNWLEGADGTIDFWEFAERIVIAKQKGYLVNLPEGEPIDEGTFYIEEQLSEEGQVWWRQRSRNRDVSTPSRGPVKHSFNH